MVDGKLTETSDKVKLDIETGNVPLPGESITGIIEGEHLDINLDIQGGTPQYRSNGLINFANQWTMHNEMDTTADDWYNWRTFDFIFTRNSKRYLRINGVAGLERTSVHQPNYATGYVDVRVTNDQLVTIAETSLSAWIRDGGASFSFTIDLGTTPLSPKYYYVQFKARKVSGGVNEDLMAGMRLTSRYLFS